MKEYIRSVDGFPTLSRAEILSHLFKLTGVKRTMSDALAKQCENFCSNEKFKGKRKQARDAKKLNES